MTSNTEHLTRTVIPSLVLVFAAVQCVRLKLDRSRKVGARKGKTDEPEKGECAGKLREHKDICEESYQRPKRALSSACGGATIFGGPLKGEDKYLGAAVGDDGCVYGIPGSAKHVLKMVPSTGEVSYLGDCRGNFVGCALRRKQFKWLRGLTAADSVYGEGAAIYGIPCNADAVLKIVPRTQEVTTMRTFRKANGETGVNPLLPGRWKWHGGALAADGNIYCVPANADRVLKIVPSTGEVCLLGDVLLPGVDQKWYGGLVGNDGCVYGMPYNANAILKINPKTSEVTTFGDLPLGGFKWHGGLRGANGVLYGIPSHADRVLRVDPEKEEVRIIGDRDINSGPLFEDHRRWKAGQYKYGGGVCGPDGCIYALPYDAYPVLKIVPKENGADEVLELQVSDPACVEDFQCHNKWQNGFVGRDGNVYAIPVSAPSILKVNPRTNEVSTIGRDIIGNSKEKWEGGVVNPNDGVLYCVPQASDVVLKIDPCGDSRFD